MRPGLNKPGAGAGNRANGAALDRLAQLLATRGLRLTRARAAIVEAALERPGHFPVEDLVADLKARGYRGSKATVYRTLPLLTDAGILQAAGVDGESRRYEAAFGREHHDHLVCRGCGAVVEFELEAFDILERDIAARHGFTLEGHQHQLFGRCPACRAASDASPPAPAGRIELHRSSTGA